MAAFFDEQVVKEGEKAMAIARTIESGRKVNEKMLYRA